LGERLLAEQSQYVADAARRFHGDTLLWAGCHTDLTDTVRGCMIRNRLYTFCQPEDSQPGTSEIAELARFRCELHAIPLPNNSLDGAVLHHGLELAEDPRTAVRELARVLAPGARLVVCGFNPMSLWGLRYAYARFFQDSFSGLRMVSPGRLLDWLTVLGFELCEEVRYMAYGLPFGLRAARDPATSGVDSREGRSEGVMPSLVAHNPPIGGVYMISAVKQALGVRRNWSLPAAGSPKLAPVAYPKLSAWSRIERPG
jgi:SAM-dependent methyltransferase